MAAPDATLCRVNNFNAERIIRTGRLCASTFSGLRLRSEAAHDCCAQEEQKLRPVSLSSTSEYVVRNSLLSRCQMRKCASWDEERVGLPYTHVVVCRCAYVTIWLAAYFQEVARGRSILPDVLAASHDVSLCSNYTTSAIDVQAEDMDDWCSLWVVTIFPFQDPRHLLWITSPAYAVDL